MNETGNAIPLNAGIGLRPEHYQVLLLEKPDIGWLEVHSENYFNGGGAPLYYLESARALYPMSIHGVGLSLGSTDPLDAVHLARLKTLIERLQPGFVSEHLAWTSISGRHFHNLLPLPYTEEALRHMRRRVAEVQDYLGRQILIENISSYLSFRHSTIPEWEFLGALARDTGCGILLDLNNIHVSAQNTRFDPSTYLSGIPRDLVLEMHLAGYTVKRTEDASVLIDSHGTRVSAPVWGLYSEALDRFGPTPTLVEWDTDLPPLQTLLGEARVADHLMRMRYAEPA